MSEQLTITCPHCHFSKTIPAGALPENVNQASCPKCKRPFVLGPETVRNAAEPESAAPAMALPSGIAAAVPPVVPEPPVAVRQPPAPRTLAFAFNGSARDYFGIWIVNTLLKIVTVGIYSAWAKVRKRRFFYGSTSLQGEAFEYLADPLALFKGWLIAAVALILYSVGTRVSPLLSIAVGLVIFLAFPWLVVRSRMFNAVNSSYRNIRFGFRPAYREAYIVFAGLMLLTILSFGLLTPYMLYRQKKFMVENSSYGTTSFTFHATIKDFYMLALKLVLGFAGIFALVGLTAAMIGKLGSPAGGSLGMAVIPALSLPLVYFLLSVYGQTALANLSWNGTCLGDGRFRSTLATKDMALLFVTNGLAILFSLGLLMPWATVRLARYRLAHLEFETTGGLDRVMATAGSAVVSAAGEEIGDVFDMPIEIAL